jgi:hypothetical protein
MVIRRRETSKKKTKAKLILSLPVATVSKLAIN